MNPNTVHMKKLSSKERIRRTIAGEPVDRIPIWPPISWHPFMPEPAPDHWKAQPNFTAVQKLMAEHCDFMVDVSIPESSSLDQSMEKTGLERVFGGYFDRRFFLASPELVEATVEATKEGGTLTTYIVHTPKGDLQTKERVEPNVDTVWTVEHLIKSVEDAEKVLSIPYRFEKPDLIQYPAEVARLEDWGTPICFVSTPLVMVSQLMDFQMFFEWLATERSLIDLMMETIYERVAERLQCVIDMGVGPLFRFGGSEQATPPMMSKRMFKQFIVKYEGPLWQMVRKAGHIPWVHCHGRVNTVLDEFVKGGVQMLDPVEPPPQGDIDIAEAKQRAAAGPMTLIGNIEHSDLCQLSTKEIEKLVQQAICDGGHKHFILGASDVPISAIDERTRDNLICFIETGVRYGTFH